ncbi:MAG: glutathione S-transferase N-terminal domain-containing protein [Bradymonadaceae bacterium]
MSSPMNNAQSWAVSILRGGRGLIVTPYCQKNPPRPEKMLELYEFESCPYCRKVREVLSELDLAYICRPCPKRGTRNRDIVKERADKLMFPYLVDPNTGTELYESEDIITYLVDTYGGGRKVAGKIAAPLNTTAAMVASFTRMKGGQVAPGRESAPAPARLLELYNFEASPYCRKAREALGELNLDYITHNVAKKSARRREFKALAGRMMVPYLVDPNTGEAMYESDDIVSYLYGTYGG